MKQGKRLNNLKWENVAVQDFPVSGIVGDFEGFVGLEECTDYGLDIGSKQPKKKKSQKKRKLSEALQDSTEVSNKKLKFSNGFIIENCMNVTPSLTNETVSKTSNNANIPKKKSGKKKNLKLGEKNVEDGNNTDDMLAWSEFQIPEEILKALAEQGFKKPTKIQELTLPPALLGRRDILGAAETGSGKTLAFGIPILAGIMNLKDKEMAGVDVYQLPYKKDSNKKKIVQVIKENNKNIKKKKNRKKIKKIVSDEDGYSSGESENEGMKAPNNNDYIEEIEVPIKKKVDRNADEGNDSENSDDYVHLSEMFDSDENDENDDERDHSEDESKEEFDDAVSTNDETEYSNSKNKVTGCVKVIDDIELPIPTLTKTGKPLYSLILTPTRELALQVSRHLTAAAKYTGIKIATLVGGMAHVKQERVLSRGPEIVVATPGRLWELIQQGQRHLQQLDNIKFLAIDETDRMVEKNHFEELHPLLEKLNSDEVRKSSRQNFVFSATLTLVHDLPVHMKMKKITKRGKILNRKIEKMTPQQKIKKLVDMIGMTNPKVVDITIHNLGAAETLTECRIACSLEQKDYYLYYILKMHPGRAIVFCNSIGSVKRLAQLFGLLKCRPLPLHASMPQRQRLKNLERFRDDPYGVLVATDVAARGLDIPNVDHVIHYQVPRTAENYVHRSGRTARATKEGLTILMIEPGEAYLYAKLCRTLNKKSELPIFPVPAHTLSSMRDVVTLAREVDKLQLQYRRTAQEQGWIDKAVKDMDILIDEDFLPRKGKDDSIGKTLQAKKKRLDALIEKPIYPKGFSFKYPTLNDPDALTPKSDENALQAMKKAIESGQLKKEKRKSKNASLLNLEKP